jgi:hypothetical protein
MRDQSPIGAILEGPGYVDEEKETHENAEVDNQKSNKVKSYKSGNRTGTPITHLFMRSPRDSNEIRLIRIDKS